MIEPIERALVVGATSPVGEAIQRELSQRYDVIGTHHRNPGANTIPFDLAEDDPSAIPIDWGALRAVVVAGGVSKLDACAREPEATARVNVDGTLRLIRHAQQAGVAPIFLSSDAVFAGELRDGYPRPKTEADPVESITTYGRQKQVVEGAILSSSGTVLRLSKLVSTRPENDGFLPDLAAQLVRGESVRAATDQFLNLTWTEDIARVVDFATAENLSGLWHVAAQPIRSRYDWSVALARELGVNQDLVRPCSLLDFEFPEPRPRDCSLDGSRLQKRLPWTLRTGDQLILDIAGSVPDQA
jgi:dTDP-4-dehydrorhamnose reductase